MIDRVKKVFPFICFCFIYLIVNLVFNFQIWKQVAIKEPQNTIFIQGESPIYEYIAERVYQNISLGKNPFTSIPDVLYPLGWNFALDDISSINGIYFLFLRPFLSIHQSLMFIVVIGIFAANLFMYLLLRLLKIEKKTAFLFGLAYGFTPFISLRVGGHPPYTSIYLFPLLTLLLLHLFERKKVVEKFVISFILGIVLVITLLTNLYYTLMVLFLIVFLTIVYFFWNRHDLGQILRGNFIFLLFTLLTVGILLVPWFESVSRIFIFQSQSNPTSIVDTIAFSSDLFGIFIPSYLNPFYSIPSAMLVKKIPKFSSIFENFNYPGLLILIPYILIILYYKRLKKYIITILPIFLVSFIFWLFTLGPFLHILGRNTLFPLPYLLLSKIPYLQMARAPGRFIVPFIFLGTIVAAFLIESFLKKIATSKKNYFFFFLFFVFFIDQLYLSTPYGIKTIPTKIYEYLASEKRAPVLEIPFVIRDGLDYFGDYHSVWSFKSQLIHKQPIFGAYFGRINDTTFSYYRNDALLGTLDKLINQTSTNTAQNTNSMDFSRIIASTDFYGIEYSIVDLDKSYSATVSSILASIGFTSLMTDSGYTLFHRVPKDKDFTQIQFGKEGDSQFLERGWGKKEESGRWVIGNVAQVLFRLKEPRKLKFHFGVKSLQTPQKMQVYINRMLIGETSLSSNLRTYTFFADNEVKQGINTISFRFTKTYLTDDLTKGYKDRRALAAFFTDISIDEGIPSSFSSVNAKEVKQIDFSNRNDEQYLLQGWSDNEAGARWTEGKSTKVLFYLTKTRPMKLHFRAESINKPQKVKAYMNGLFTGDVTVATNVSKDYFVDVSNAIRSGENILNLQFSHTEQLSKIGGDPNDTRELSLYLKYLALED